MKASDRASFFLKTFGEAVLRDASGHSIALSSKPLALLVLLRLNTPQSRGELMRMLWEDLPGDARNALSQALSVLRRLFPDLPRGKRWAEWSGRDRIVCDVDVLLTGWRDPNARWRAVFAYDGPFLKNFRIAEGEQHFREWIEQQRLKYEQAFRRLWELEVGRAEAEKLWDNLDTLARHAVEVDPLWQPGHAARIRALASNGETDAAHSYYNMVHRILQSQNESIHQELYESGLRIDEWATLATVPAESRVNHEDLSVVADLDAVPPQLLAELLGALDEAHRALGGGGYVIRRAFTGSEAVVGAVS
jgi:DNA-binding SARP family transcriptional activator